MITCQELVTQSITIVKGRNGEFVRQVALKEGVRSRIAVLTGAATDLEAGILIHISSNRGAIGSRAGKLRGTFPVTAFYKGESQEKNFPGDWKEQRFLPGSPAYVM